MSRLAPHRGASHQARLGQSTVELAIMLPFLLLLILGAIDMTSAFRQRIAIADAAREAARFSINFPRYADASSSPPKSNDPNNITARAIGELTNAGVTVNSGDITITWIPGTALPRPIGCTGITTPTTTRTDYTTNPTCYDFVKVDVRHDYQPLTPGVSQIVGSVIHLQTSATGRIQSAQ